MRFGAYSLEDEIGENSSSSSRAAWGTSGVDTCVSAFVPAAVAGGTDGNWLAQIGSGGKSEMRLAGNVPKRSAYESYMLYECPEH